MSAQLVKALYDKNKEQLVLVCSLGSLGHQHKAVVGKRGSEFKSLLKNKNLNNNNNKR